MSEKWGKVFSRKSTQNSANIEQIVGVMGKQICRRNKRKMCKNMQKMSEKWAKIFCRRSAQISAKIKQNVGVMDKYVGKTGQNCSRTIQKCRRNG